MITITLQDLSGLVDRFMDAEKDVAEKEKAFKASKERLALYQENLLPNTLRELDVREYKLGDGRVISLDMKVSCGVTDLTMDAAEAWLTEHNLDGIIKHQVIVEFGKGENEQANEMLTRIREELEKMEMPLTSATDKKAIHFQTLAAMVREQMAQGVDVPEEPFQLFITDRVKVKK